MIEIMAASHNICQEIGLESPGLGSLGCQSGLGVFRHKSSKAVFAQTQLQDCNPGPPPAWHVLGSFR